MPISFKQLEDLLIDWKTFSRLHANKRIGDRTGQWVYSKMTEKIDSIYLEKIRKLFENIDIKNIEIIENIKLQRSYGGFKTNKVVIINSNL